jgi:hypothetical protein
MGARFSYENGVSAVKAAAPVAVVTKICGKAAVRVGMVTGWAFMVDYTCVKVSDAGGMVRAPDFKGAPLCEVVCCVVFMGTGVHRVVAGAMGMGAIACVNVGPRAVKGAMLDAKVSAASVAAGMGLERMSTHAPGAPRRAGTAGHHE